MSIATRIESISNHLENAYDELQGLGADLSNINKNIENISMVLDDIYDSMPQVNGEGTSLTLDNTKVGKIKSTLKGNTSQSGTPTPTTPIPINAVSGDNKINVVGKNLWRFDNNNLYRNASTTSNAINENTLQVTSVSNTYANAAYKVDLPDGTYTFNLGKVTNSNTNMTTKRMTLSTFVNGTRTVIQHIDEGTPRTISIVNAIDKQYVLEFWATYTTAFINTATFEEVQIEKGSTVTTYEPYQGNTYNIDLPVENLFNDSTLNNKWVAQNGTITSATGANCIKYNCNTNDTYTLSATFGTSSPNNIIVMAFYNSSDTLLNRYVATTNTSLTMTYTAPANTSYMYAGHYGIVPTTIQLEKGSKQNSFTPHGTTPIELCKIGDYQDKIAKSTGKNLFNEKITPENYFYNASGEKTYDSNNLYINQTIENINYNSITISFFSKIEYASVRVCEYNSSGTFISRTLVDTNNQVVNLNNTTTKIILSVNSNSNAYFNCLMINEGNTALPYEPYGKVWYLNKQIGKKVYSGSEYFGYGASGETGISLLNTGGIGMKQGNYLVGLSNYFKNNQSGKLANTIRFGANDTNLWIYVNNSDFASAEAFKTWLSTHNTEIYYVLATPTYEEITGELLSQLETIKYS